MSQELDLADTLKIVFFIFYVPYLIFKIVVCLLMDALFEG